MSLSKKFSHRFKITSQSFDASSFETYVWITDELDKKQYVCPEKDLNQFLENVILQQRRNNLKKLLP